MRSKGSTTATDTSAAAEIKIAEQPPSVELASLAEAKAATPDQVKDADAATSAAVAAAKAPEPQYTVERKAGTKYRIVLAGDSTVTDNAGWGLGFAACLADNVECINLSRGGRSSGSFVKEGRWQTALELKPDYVLIQFGHNDEPGHGAERETDPATTYKANMERYADEAQAAGIVPVLVTPMSRRQFQADGHIKSSLQPYADTVKQIAKAKNVYLIDLHWRSIEVYESLGKAGCELISPMKENNTKFDGTHLNEAGHNVFGPLVAKELQYTIPELIRSFPTSKLQDMQRTAAPVSPSVLEQEKNPPQAEVTAPAPKGAKTIIVAADGSGDYRTVQEAIAAAPENNSERTVIHIKPGTYYGQIVVPANKPNLMFDGEIKETTILTYALTKHDPVPPGVMLKYKGDGVVIQANDFQAQNLTFRNTAGDRGQAMALVTEGDRGIYRNCNLIGWQDTLLTAQNRQYFRDCQIEGRVDYIYGASTAVFDNCEIKTKYNGYCTAASTPQENPFGYVFLNCKLTTLEGTPTYLGRPWRPYASVAYINCWMDQHIRPEGWHNWNKPANEQTARYSEFNSSGPGANPAQRVAWSRQLSAEEARQYTIQNVLKGNDNWNPEMEVAAK